MKKLLLGLIVLLFPIYCQAATITRYVNPGADAGGDGATSALTGANCAYQSLNAALLANEQDLTDSGGDILVISCAGSTADTTVVASTSLDGYTTNETSYIRIIGNMPYGQSSSLRFNSSYYHMTCAAHFVDMLNMTRNYSRIENIQIDLSNYASRGIVLSGSNCLVMNSIVYNTNNGTSNTGFAISGGGTIINSIAYKINFSGFVFNTFTTSYFYNCVSYGNGVGFEQSGGSTSHIITNCIGNSNTNNYSGTFTTSYSCSDTDSELSGTGDRNGSNGDVTFVNVGSGTEDFHLSSSDTNAKDLGTSLSGTFTIDIDGETRSGTWDIGADEYVGPTIITPVGKLFISGGVKFD